MSFGVNSFRFFGAESHLMESQLQIEMGLSILLATIMAKQYKQKEILGFLMRL
jgi:hypothetical protein